jgi:hypothetical protein
MRSYTKPNPEKPVLAQKSQKAEVADSELSVMPINVADVNYKKEHSVKSPKVFL